MSTNNKWYVYAKLSDLTISSVSPIKNQDFDLEETIEIEILEDLGIAFIEKPHLMFDYFVYYESGIPKLIKRDTVIIDERLYSILRVHEKPDSTESEIIFEIDTTNKTLEVSIPPELVGYIRSAAPVISVSGTTMEIYVTDKGNPNNLIKTLKLSIDDLIGNLSMKIDYDFDTSVTDLYVKEIFKKYKLNIK